MLDCLVIAESNSTIPNFQTASNVYWFLRLMVSPINYAWLDSPAIVFCFSDSVEVQFRCGWNRELFISACLLKSHFFRLSARLFLESFQDLDFRGVSIAGLIDNCVVLFVNVYALFALNLGLTLKTLSKQTNTTCVNLRGTFIYFILCRHANIEQIKIGRT